jgi:uncharacterized protein YqeY
MEASGGIEVSIQDEVTAQLKEAMRAKDAARTNALRNIRAAFLNEMKRDNAQSLDDETCVGLLRRLEKQRKESIEAFESAGRTEQAGAERGELEVIQAFLPRLADEETTRAWVREAIAASGAAGPGDVGRVMGTLMKTHKGEMDGGLANRIARELLSG